MPKHVTSSRPFSRSPNAVQFAKSFCAKAIIILLFGLFSNTSFAASFYVRTDGGTAAQCNGTVNVAYSKTAAPACAWSGPMIALGSGGEQGVGASPVLIHGGDTLYIVNNTGNAQYQIGMGAPGATGTGCNINFPYDCIMNPVPPGTASAPTQIIGVASNGVNPQLWGNQRVAEILNLSGSSYTTVSNLEITDHVACIYAHPTNPCPRSTPFAAGTNAAYADAGVFIYNATGVVLNNLNIHNIANEGILAGKLTNFTMNNVTLRANGWVGFNNDLSSRGFVASNSGNINFNHVVIQYSGCGEQYPATTIYGCWGQNEGGYGDGLGAAATGGNWTIADSQADHNTQDGFDLLYADGTGSVTFSRSIGFANAGNQFKMAGTSTLQSVVAIGNCAAMNGLYPQLGTGDMCRAEGNTVAIAGMPGKAITVKDSTFTAQGTCQVIMAGNSTGGNVTIANNIFVGQGQFLSPGDRTCTFFDSGTAPATVSYFSNIEYQDKTPAQPGSLTVDPKLANETLANFNPILLAGSPAIGAANATYQVAYDFTNTARTLPGDIGAYRYQLGIRVLDTRPGAVTTDGLFAGTGPVGAQQQIDLTVLGRGGIPASGVTAVALNVTATNPTAAGYITVWPSGTSRPNASNLNVLPGQTIANLVIVKVGGNGKVSLLNATGSTDLIADVQTYFTSDSGLNPLVPARLLDTRTGAATIDGQFAGIGAVGNSAPLDLGVAGRGGLPASGVAAVILNVTATNPTKAGYVTVCSADSAKPNSSNLNFVAGLTIPNLVITKVSSGGQVALYNSNGTTDLIADVMGWFPAGSSLTPLVPARLLDTRLGYGTIDGEFAGTGALGPLGTISLTVTGRGNVPSNGVGSVILNVTVTNPTAAGYLTAWPSGTARPFASNINFVAGQTIPNLVIAKVGSAGQVSLFNSSGSSDVVADVVGWLE